MALKEKTMQTAMRALVLSAYGGEAAHLDVQEIPIPKPAPGEVLVRMAAAPANPSDLMFLQGKYGVRKKLPVVPGFEGSGIVVESGGGLMAGFLVGRRVACTAPNQRNGTWAEYMVTKSNLCLPLRKQVSLEQGATLIVNPFTAIALMDIEKREKQPAVVQNAAASALGRMILNTARRMGIAIINIIRRHEQVDLLKSRGAEYILNSTDPDFEVRFRDLCANLGARLVFDAIGGDETGRLLECLPVGGHVMVYGGLAQQPCNIDPGCFIFQNKSVDGFWLSEWFPRQSLPHIFLTALRVQESLERDLSTDIRERVPLEAARGALQNYAAHMTGGKILLVPNQDMTARPTA